MCCSNHRFLRQKRPKLLQMRRPTGQDICFPQLLQLYLSGPWFAKLATSTKSVRSGYNRGDSMVVSFNHVLPQAASSLDHGLAKQMNRLTQGAQGTSDFTIERWYDRLLHF